MSKKILIALGGNSFIKDAAHSTVRDQYLAVSETSRYIAEIIAEGRNVVITHGNGPQVGFILRRSELSRHELHEVPLVSCVADTQGALGFHIQQTLMNELRKLNVEKPVLSIVTQVLVDRNDPSFSNPKKPIGQFYGEQEAQKIMTERGWIMIEDADRGWRRVVPSPAPKEIVEIEAIRKIFDSGFVLIAAGGGGIPVVRREDGSLEGIDAVIDKDLTSALLANLLGIKEMVISTSVPNVCLNFGKSDEKPIHEMNASEARLYIKEGHFKSGSMLPKIEAALNFLEGGGEKVIITDPPSIHAALEGKAGTHIV